MLRREGSSDLIENRRSLGEGDNVTYEAYTEHHVGHSEGRTLVKLDTAPLVAYADGDSVNVLEAKTKESKW